MPHLDFIEDSAEHFSAWTRGAYSKEMWVRLQYFNGSQFVQNFSALTRDFEGVVSVVNDPASVEDWNASWSGPGWDDIRAMLPEATENIVVQPVGVPFAKAAIKNLAVLYAVSPEARDLTLDGDKNEEATTLLEQVDKAALFNQKAHLFEEWVLLFNTAFQFVGWEERRKRLTYRNLAPFEVWAFADPSAPTDLQHPNALVAIQMHTPDGSPIVWQVWHENLFWFEDEAGDVQNGQVFVSPYWYFDPDGPHPEPGVPEGQEPRMGYAIKPVLVQHDEPSDILYRIGTNDLILMNQRLDRDMTALGHVAEWQGFAIPTVTGVDVDELKGTAISPASFIALDLDARVDFAHPVAPMGEAMNVLVRKARMFARLKDLDPEQVDPDSKVVSGVSRAQTRINVQERRETQIQLWKPYERERYWLASTVWNAHVPNNTLPIISRDAMPGEEQGWELEVIFGRLPAVPDPLANVLTQEKRVKLGLNTVPDFISAERRIPQETAEQIYKANLAFNEANQPLTTFGQMLQGDSEDRIGQPGNRPQEEDEPASQTGGILTAASGNQVLGGT